MYKVLVYDVLCTCVYLYVCILCIQNIVALVLRTFSVQGIYNKYHRTVELVLLQVLICTLYKYDVPQSMYRLYIPRTKLVRAPSSQTD